MNLAQLLVILMISATAKCKRVVVVGAGAAGLIATKVLRDQGLSVTCLEKSTAIGGVWNYDANCKGSNGPMYSTLRSNLPKEIMAIPSRPFEDELALRREMQEQWNAFKMSNLENARDDSSNHLDEYESSESSFVNHLEVQLYLERFAVETDLMKSIELGTDVKSISKEEGGEWLVEYTSAETGTVTEKFDGVVVANGHYNEPFVPRIEGDTFTGVQVHSRDYDGPYSNNGLFVDKDVLIVGGRSSGTDLAREISEVASSVHCSDRNAALECTDKQDGTEKGRGGHSNLYYHPGIKSCTNAGTHITFTDDSKLRVDVVVWCTGYLYDFPFLSEDILVTGEGVMSADAHQLSCNGRRLRGLYEQLFSAVDPSLSFIGIPYAIVPFPLFYVQARWVAAVLSGHHRLPSFEERQKWIIERERQLQEMGRNTDSKYHYFNEEQWEYNRRVAALGHSDESHLKALLDEITLSEAIYLDNSQARPPAVGLPDDYRSALYKINRDTGTFERVMCNVVGRGNV